MNLQIWSKHKNLVSFSIFFSYRSRILNVEKEKNTRENKMTNNANISLGVIIVSWFPVKYEFVVLWTPWILSGPFFETKFSTNYLKMYFLLKRQCEGVWLLFIKVRSFCRFLFYFQVKLLFSVVEIANGKRSIFTVFTKKFQHV